MLVNQNIAQNAYLYTVILFVSTPIASIDRIRALGEWQFVLSNHLNGRGEQVDILFLDPRVITLFM